MPKKAQIDPEYKLDTSAKDSNKNLDSYKHLIWDQLYIQGKVILPTRSAYFHLAVDPIHILKSLIPYWKRITIHV